MTALDDRPALALAPDVHADLAAAHRTISVIWGQVAEAERQVALRDARLADAEELLELQLSVLALDRYAHRQRCAGSLDDWVAATADRDAGRCAALRRGRRSDPPRFCRRKGHPHGPAVRYADAGGSRA